jgi:hypothetical protein
MAIGVFYQVSINLAKNYSLQIMTTRYLPTSYASKCARFPWFVSADGGKRVCNRGQYVLIGNMTEKPSTGSSLQKRQKLGS